MNQEIDELLYFVDTYFLIHIICHLLHLSYILLTFCVAFDSVNKELLLRFSV